MRSNYLYLVVLIGVLFLIVGCPTGDDGTSIDCATAESCEGNYEPLEESDFAIIDQCDSIIGDLEILEQAWLTSIDMPCLTSVGGRLIVSTPSLTSIDMSSLTDVGGELRVMSNHTLTSIDVSSLSTVDGGLWVGQNTTLTTIDLSSLTNVEGLNVTSNDFLTSFNASGLADAGNHLIIGNNAALTGIEMSNLTYVSGYLLEISTNNSLTSLDGLSNTVSVDGDLNISHNDCLSQTEAEAFAAGITVGGTVTVEDNGANYPCN